MKLNLFGFFKKSFRFKVILIGIVLMLLTCFALTAFFVHHQHRTLNKSLVEQGRLLAQVLGHSAKIGIFSENTDLLAPPVDGIVLQQKVKYVVVFNGDGKRLYAAGSSLKEPNGQSERPDSQIPDDLQDKLRGTDGTIFFSEPDALQVWSTVFAAQRYSNSGALFFERDAPQKTQRAIGFIQIGIGKQIYNKQILDFLVTATLITLGAAVIGSLLMFLIIRRITSPLNRLAEGIKALGKSEFPEPLPVATEDEIGRLAIAFNDMAESLKRRKAENYHLEVQLRQAQKLEALGTLAGGIAHDFNNVLSPIFGYTEMAIDEVHKDERLHSNLKEVLHAAGRARDLVKQILAFSRQNEKESMPMHIQSVLKEALKLLRASVPTTISIKEHIDKNCGPIFADPTNIHRIIMNLGTNAYHAMRDQGGELTFVLEEEILEENDERLSFLKLNPGHYVKLSVSDTGMGMDKNTRQRIFDPYFTTKPLGEGTGMGLATAHGIVKNYQGAIMVQSEPEKGSCFQVYFPRIKSEASSAQPASTESIPHGHENILLVDDEAPIVFMLKQTLENLGYQVTARTSSLEALEAFAASQKKFDLIITDQTMPNMTGHEFAAEAIRLREDIPIILCTGYSEQVDKEKVKHIGIRAFLMKPVVKQRMAETIRMVLDEENEGASSHENNITC